MCKGDKRSACPICMGVPSSGPEHDPCVLYVDTVHCYDHSSLPCHPSLRSIPLATQVLDAKVVVDRPKGTKSEGLKVAECLVADKTGCIIFSARNDQGGGHACFAHGTSYKCAIMCAYCIISFCAGLECIVDVHVTNAPCCSVAVCLAA